MPFSHALRQAKFDFLFVLEAASRVALALLQGELEILHEGLAVSAVVVEEV
jgi:hypothetical protein